MSGARVAAIVGPTAAGKTELALEVAEALDAEIVSMDSMQVYRAMDAGTAKPSSEAMARVPYHLVDVIDPDHDLAVAEFQGLARAAIADVSGRGKLPLLVGGSGLYFRAVVDDLRFPPRSLDVREALETEAETEGAEKLHARLAEIDPVAATRIEPMNVRRTVRALEVIALTGRPFSENDSWERFESIYDLRAAGVTWPRDELYARIAVRAEEMLANELVDEVRSLDGKLSRTARQALGYRQVLDMPDAPRAEVLAEIVRATKRFARRQESWFRADPRIRWFEASAPEVTTRLIGYLRGDPAGIE